MKFLIAFAALVAVAYATEEDTSAVLTKSVSDVNPDGSYHYQNDLSNKISFEETGSLRELKDAETGKPVPAIVATGSYRYISPDGTPIEVTYVADENGFQPQGAHLPKPQQV